MRALAVMSIAASLAGCAKPDRGEHLVHWPNPVSGLGLDASGIYASVAIGQVMRAPREGGTAEFLAVVTDAFNLSVSGNIVLTDTEIILTDWGPAEGQGRIVAVAKAGGATRVIVQSQG